MNRPKSDWAPLQPASRRDLWQLTQVASGFLWTVPAVLVLGVYTIQTPPFTRAPLWWFIMAQGLVAVSALRLLLIRWNGARAWRRSARWTLFWALAALLQSPYLHWWQQNPTRWPFVLNMGVALFFEAALLFQLNRWSGVTAAQLNDPDLAAEARLFAQMVLWLLSAPVLALMGRSIFLAARHGLPTSDSAMLLLEEAVAGLEGWILLAWIVPVAFTLQLLWKLRQRAVAQLLAGGAGPAALRGPDQKIV